MRYIPFEKFPRVERRIRKLLRSKSPTRRRDALAYGLGLHGLRCGEVINLTIGDLDTIDELLSVQTLKGGTPRRLSLGPGFFEAIKRLGAKRAKSSRLFVTTKGEPVDERHLQRGFRKLSRELLGGSGLTFHSLRHTYAMRFYAKTKDFQRLMGRLGHRQPSSTQVYIGAYHELDDERLERIVRNGFEILPSLVVRRRKGRGSTERGEVNRKTVRAKTPAASKRERKTGSDVAPLLRLFGHKLTTPAELHRQRQEDRRSG